jgi:NTP pyrophosphatase (non-canonical NTP hydrolase)
MNISQYRNEATRTVKDLGTPILNSIHMTSGIVTELVELIEATSPGDILDESVDAVWYLANYCNLHDLKLEQKEDALSTKFVNVIMIMIKLAGKLLDFDKKNLAYGKPYNHAVQQETVQRLYDLIHGHISTNHMTIEDGMDKNIKKLYIRFPVEATGELAINKDEAKEKEVYK